MPTTIEDRLDKPEKSEPLKYLREWSVPGGVALLVLGLAFMIGTVYGGPILLSDGHDYSMEGFRDAMAKTDYLNISRLMGEEPDREYIEGMDARRAAERIARSRRVVGRELALGGFVCAIGALSTVFGVTVRKQQ